MSCHRTGCESIMCDTYVDSVGYVCNECQNEFKDYVKSEGLDVSTKGKIERALKGFMNTDKNSFTEGKEISIEEFFEKYR